MTDTYFGRLKRYLRLNSKVKTDHCLNVAEWFNFNFKKHLPVNILSLKSS